MNNTFWKKTTEPSTVFFILNSVKLPYLQSILDY